VWRGATGFAARHIGNTGGMRRGAILLAVLTGALATAGGTAPGSGLTSQRLSAVAAVTLPRAELADTAGTGITAHIRDDATRELDARRDLVAVLGVLLTPLLACWWLVAERRRASDRIGPRAIRRKRAPPRVSVTVQC
jgi:hypothetical protein